MNITKGDSPDPVPSWLEDVDDESASARPASAAGATPLANRAPTTDDARDGADAPATATDDAQAGSGGTAQADDESAATWRASSGSPASGTLAATWSALGFGDEAPDEPAAETSRTAADAPRSWDDASWKADSGTDPDDDFAATAATADEVGIGDDDTASDTASDTDSDTDTDTDTASDTDSDTDDAGTGIEASAIIDTDSTGVDDGARLDDAPESAAAGSGLAASGLAGEGEAEPGNVRDPSGTQQVSVVPGVPRYHDPNCILIRFMPTDDVQQMSVPEAEEAGCTPCRACQSE